MRNLLLLLIFAMGTLAFAQGTDSLAKYARCKFAGGPEVVETAPLGPGVHSRTVNTRRGPRSIAMEEGKRIMFAYPGEDFYANVKAERLPAATYAEEKQWLIDEFEKILAGDGDNARNYDLKPKLNGFEIYGLDRGKLKGGVLGIYLLFDDTRKEVVTIYFLNQDPEKRFHTIQEYRTLRSRFLDSYTSCLAKNE